MHLPMIAWANVFYSALIGSKKRKVPFNFLLKEIPSIYTWLGSNHSRTPKLYKKIIS